MTSILEKIICVIRAEIELWKSPAATADDSLDAALAEARRRFPHDRAQQEIDAFAELQCRAFRGERRHDA